MHGVFSQQQPAASGTLWLFRFYNQELAANYVSRARNFVLEVPACATGKWYMATKVLGVEKVPISFFSVAAAK